MSKTPTFEEFSKLSDEERQQLLSEAREERNARQQTGQPAPEEIPTEEEPVGVTKRGLVESALAGQTAGISDPVIAALEAGTGEFAELIGQDEEKGIGQRYEEASEGIRERREGAGMAGTGAEIAGALIPSPINVGSKLYQAGKFAFGAGQKLAKGAKAGEVLGAGARQAGAAGTEAVGYEGARQISQGLTGGDVDTGEVTGGAGMSAATGMGMVAVPRALNKLGSSFGKRAMAKASGESVEYIDAFLKDADNIKNAKNVQELLPRFEDLVERAHGLGNEAKMELARLMNNLAYRQYGVLSNMSAHSYKILEKNKTKFNKKAVTALLDRFKASRKIGTADLENINPAISTEYRRFVKFWADVPPVITAVQAKDILQEIDTMGRIFDQAGGGNSKHASLVREARRLISEQLKRKDPEYKKFMNGPMKNASELFNELDQHFKGVDTKDVRTAYRTIEKFAKEGKIGLGTTGDAALLKAKVEDLEMQMKRRMALGEEIPAEELAELQRKKHLVAELQKFASPTENLIAKAYNFLKYEEHFGKGVQRKEATKLAKQVAGTGATKASRHKSLRALVERIQKSALVTSELNPKNTQKKIKAMVEALKESADGKDENALLRVVKEQLESLEETGRYTSEAEELFSEMKKAGLIEELQRTAMKGRFEKVGSKELNLWQLTAGAGIPYAATGLSAEMAALGFFTVVGIRRNSKHILSAMAKMRGAPTVQKIRNATDDPETQEMMIRELVKFYGIAGDSEDWAKKPDVEVVDAAMMMSVRDMYKNYDPVRRAAALSKLNRTNKISFGDFASYVLTQPPTPASEALEK